MATRISRACASSAARLRPPRSASGFSARSVAPAPPPAPAAGRRGPSPPSPAALRRSSRSGSRRRSRAGRGCGPWRGQPPCRRPAPRRRRVRRNPLRTRQVRSLSVPKRSSNVANRPLPGASAGGGHIRTHPTIPAVSITAWKSTFAPFSAQSRRDLLGLVVRSPSTQGT